MIFLKKYDIINYNNEREEKIKMKLWLDDVRPAPEGYVWIKFLGQK